MKENVEIEEISQCFYSNCLLQALKSKIKNPKVRITKKPIRGTWVPHFEWEDDNYLYDFGANARICTPLLFKGCIRRQVNSAKEGEEK